MPAEYLRPKEDVGSCPPSEFGSEAPGILGGGPLAAWQSIPEGETIFDFCWHPSTNWSDTSSTPSFFSASRAHPVGVLLGSLIVACST
jgi:hypothetical protein